MAIARNPNGPEEIPSKERIEKMKKDLEKIFGPSQKSKELMKKRYMDQNRKMAEMVSGLNLGSASQRVRVTEPIEIINKKTKWDYFIIYSGWIVALIVGFIFIYDRFFV